jgi:hypothetical protein
MAGWNVRARSVQAGLCLAGAILCAAAPPAAAEVRVTDAGDGKIVIEAHDATVREILDALGGSRTIRFQASDALSRAVTGTYTGTLPRVLSRILAGYDHVIRSTRSGLQIDIVGAAHSPQYAGSVANVVVSAVPHAAAHVSGNVDADEEAASQNSAAAGPHTVNLAVAPHPGASAVRPAPAVLRASQPSSAPRVSGNLDLDEEMAR